MKIGILSDCHLGEIKFRKQINSENAWCHINNECFKQSIDILSKKSDIIIIPGDLFDSPNPDINSLLTANYLSELMIPVFIIGGNHDFSQRNDHIGCHPYNLLHGHNITKVYNDIKITNINIKGTKAEITLVPYKCVNEDTYKDIFKGDLKDKKDRFNILVMHGYLSKDYEELNEFRLPESVAMNYDLVLLGHIHNSNLIQTNINTILTPGSIMPSKSYMQDHSYIWIFDTETKSIEKIEIEDAPKMNEYFVSGKEEVNNLLLKNIIEGADKSNRLYDLYSINYNGSIKDIDEFLYKKAYEKSLNISLSTCESQIQSNINKIDNFWDFIELNHPEWADEFKNICIRS